MDYGDVALDPFARSEWHIPIVTEVDEDAKAPTCCVMSGAMQRLESRWLSESPDPACFPVEGAHGATRQRC